MLRWFKLLAKLINRRQWQLEREKSPFSTHTFIILKYNEGNFIIVFVKFKVSFYNSSFELLKYP